jgi:hypothetical protein
MVKPSHELLDKDGISFISYYELIPRSTRLPLEEYPSIQVAGPKNMSDCLVGSQWCSASCADSSLQGQISHLYIILVLFGYSAFRQTIS